MLVSERPALFAHFESSNKLFLQLTMITCMQEYSREEVAEHNSRDRRVWVTYKDGVYDVTDFLDMHPGGAQRLMLAAGGAIDPFWAMYAQHNTQEVHKMLEGYRIGELVRHSITMYLEYIVLKQLPTCSCI